MARKSSRGSWANAEDGALTSRLSGGCQTCADGFVVSRGGMLCIPTGPVFTSNEHKTLEWSDVARWGQDVLNVERLWSGIADGIWFRLRHVSNGTVQDMVLQTTGFINRK